MPISTVGSENNYFSRASLVEIDVNVAELRRTPAQEEGFVVHLVLIEDQSAPIPALLPKFRRSISLFHIGVSKYSGSYLTNPLQVNLSRRAKNQVAPGIAPGSSESPDTIRI